MMKVSSHGIALIKEFEGFFSKEAYKCPAGVWTIGYGSTHYEDGQAVKSGDVISQAYAEKLFQHDVAVIERQLIMALNADEIIVSQEQFDALVDFAYNLGASKLVNSTLWKKLKVKDYESAANEFLKWNKIKVKVKKIVNGQVVVVFKLVEVEGLTRRRQAEQKLFLS